MASPVVVSQLRGGYISTVVPGLAVQTDLCGAGSSPHVPPSPSVSLLTVSSRFGTL